MAATPGPVLFTLSGIDGTCRDVMPWLAAWPEDWTLYGVLDRAAVSTAAPAEMMAELAEQAVEAIQAAGHAGPFHFAGYSFGGRLAYETAVRPRAGGEQIGFLGMIDTPAWVEAALPASPNPIVQARRRAIQRHRVTACDVPVTFFRTSGAGRTSRTIISRRGRPGRSRSSGCPARITASPRATTCRSGRAAPSAGARTFPAGEKPA